MWQEIRWLNGTIVTWADLSTCLQFKKTGNYGNSTLTEQFVDNSHQRELLKVNILYREKSLSRWFFLESCYVDMCHTPMNKLTDNNVSAIKEYTPILVFIQNYICTRF